MLVGIPKEIKIGENRVAATPKDVEVFLRSGHKLKVEKKAGIGSGFSDQDYLNAGAELVSTPKEIWDSDLVIKVKEPISQEMKLFHKDLILFTYLHLASPLLKDLTYSLMNERVTSIAYETVKLSDGSLPLLEPMSAVAGKMAIQVAAQFLTKTFGGRGVMLTDMPNVPRCNVLIIGAGTVGLNAAEVALRLGANVTVINRGTERLLLLKKKLEKIETGKLFTIKMNSNTLENALINTDVAVGAIYTTGARSPLLVTEEMVKKMRKGSVIIDVDIDQGGIFETAHPTTHKNPIYVKEGIIHYCVTNMPGAVPRTSTLSLTRVTIPFALKIAELGFIQAVKRDGALANGVSTYKSYITNKQIAQAHNLPYKPLSQLL
jgi:alanine dehydrogenase